MDRTLLVKLWNEAWEKGLWAAAWSKSVEGLTPKQAAWKPAVGRHSIWQIVSHMTFWRNDALGRLANATPPTEDQIKQLNFPEPAEVSDKAWHDTIEKFLASQQKVAAAMQDPKNTVERIVYLLPHDCYHMGQINLLRALQGMNPIE